MPLSNAERAAIRAAAGQQSAGNPVRLTDRGFWARFGLPSMSERRDILSRANAIVEASGAIDPENPSGTLGDVFAGTGFPAGPGGGGPLDNASGRVFVRVPYVKGRKTQWRSYSMTFDWDTTIEEILADLGDTLEEQEGFYDIGEADLASAVFFVT